MSARMGPIVAFVIINFLMGGTVGAQYLGKFLGKLSELHHGVSGEVYAVDGRTLFLKDFTYDGQGPAAYFYASTSRNANSAGFRLRDESGSGDVIRRYRKEGVTLTLPEGKSLNNIKIFYVWCEEFEVNFGDVKIPRNFDYPRPQKIEPLKGVHAISSDNIVIVDAQTLLIPNLSYDGEAPDAKFWVGRGPKPSPQGIRVPDENGKEVPLRRYDRKTVVLTLPGDLTVFDIGHFGIWCEAFTVDFGHVQIPQTLNVPPSLKMLGVSPQSKLNCEVLYDDLAFEVRWAVAGDSIVLQLVAKLDNREYMSFGVSGDDSRSEMVGGDVAVAWVDKDTLKGFAEDYYLGAKSQCSGPTGSCPDNRLRDNSNNIRLLNAAMVNGYSIVTYQRPLKPSDEYDRQIHTNKSQAIIWAIGPLNQRNEVSFHSHYTKGDRFLDFGRPAKWNCPMPESEQPPMKPVAESKKQYDPPTTTTTAAPSRGRNPERRRGSGANRGASRQEVNDNEKSATRPRQTERRGGSRRGANAAKPVPTPAPVVKRDAWEIPAIQCNEPEDGVFYAQMGPTGGKRGYPAITGHVGWGISWYINGLLIPEVNVVRGKQYTFVVEGGFDPEVPAKYHPFYITDDSVGGYVYKTDEEKKNITIFAGAITAKDGSVNPTGTGRLCHWTQQGDKEADDFESFGAYQRTLELKCDQGEPGVIQWTPDKNTPDTVYYQCFTHRYLGWKINVLDSCDTQPAASEVETVVVPAPSVDLEESPSIRVETRVKPNDIVVEDKEDKDKSTVSEKSTVSPITDPPQEPPQTQLPLKEPILIQPQQSFYSPPPIYMSHGPFFNAYNPYVFENPFYYNPYQQSFKPSPPLGNVKEDFVPKPEISSEAPIETTTVPSTTTTTITITTTSTEKPKTTSTLPSITEKITVEATDVKPVNQSFFTPQNKIMFTKNNFGNFVMRRPPGPKHRPYPMKPPMRPMPVRYNQFKKTIYRPPMKIMHSRPINKPFPPMHDPAYYSDMPLKRYPQPSFILYKPPGLRPPTTPFPIATVDVKNVEISPEQASTEKEPEIQTAPPSSALVTVQPVKETFSVFKMRPALNTGFHPESVIIESGFKPIVSKEFQKRMSEDEPELEYESELGVIDMNQRASPEIPQNFEPMFVPSPVDKPQRNKLKLQKKTIIKKVIIKQARSLDDDELVPAAAERVESYYLPPLGKPPKIPDIPHQRSNIDIEPASIDLDSPPDVVVTYDGRKVSGASLTAKIADRSSILDMRASKAAELIKARPQFVPFKGELPPLNPEIINRNAPQLQARGLISRDLDTPAAKSGSTKLSLVRQIGDEHRGENRRKRAAHHTPEHTAEQERQNNSTAKSGACGFKGVAPVSIFVVVYFLKYI